jgi:hypothetical protein
MPTCGRSTPKPVNRRAMWHQSKSDPRIVYDGEHSAVCVMSTPEQAEFVVAAVNAYRPVAAVQAEVAKIETLKASLAEIATEARKREPEKDSSFGIIHRRR